MFMETIRPIFSFLEKEFGFTVKLLDARSVQYQRGDLFIRILHSHLDEISLRIGLLSKGSDMSFSIGALIALTSPKQGFSYHDRIASKPEQITDAIDDLSQLLKIHGSRVLKGDLKVFDEMKKIVDQYRLDRNDTQIRQRAEKAFTNKNYLKALEQYRLLGSRIKPLDGKRMELCKRYV